MYDFKENNEVCIFNFNDDYTFKLELAGVEYDGTWELIEGGLMITDTDNKQANIYYKEGELLWTLQQGHLFFFCQLGIVDADLSHQDIHLLFQRRTFKFLRIFKLLFCLLDRCTVRCGLIVSMCHISSTA